MFSEEAKKVGLVTIIFTVNVSNETSCSELTEMNARWTIWREVGKAKRLLLQWSQIIAGTWWQCGWLKPRHRWTEDNVRKQKNDRSLGTARAKLVYRCKQILTNKAFIHLCLYRVGNNLETRNAPDTGCTVVHYHFPEQKPHPFAV